MSEVGTVERPILDRVLLVAGFGFVLVSEAVWLSFLAYFGWWALTWLV